MRDSMGGLYMRDSMGELYMRDSMGGLYMKVLPFTTFISTYEKRKKKSNTLHTTHYTELHIHTVRSFFMLYYDPQSMDKLVLLLHFGCRDEL